jgi:hypothetical protein
MRVKFSEFNELAPACSECSGVGVVVGGETIYPHRPDLFDKMFYRCKCGAYVGCHPGTVKALGTPAGAETRRARSAAHAAFDPLWKRKLVSRGAAYKMLADFMGLRSSDCHISWFDVEQCGCVVELSPLIARSAKASA